MIAMLAPSRAVPAASYVACFTARPVVSSRVAPTAVIALQEDYISAAASRRHFRASDDVAVMPLQADSRFTRAFCSR